MFSVAARPNILQPVRFTVLPFNDLTQILSTVLNFAGLVDAVLGMGSITTGDTPASQAAERPREKSIIFPVSADAAKSAN
jgi:hypothetical protein